MSKLIYIPIIHSEADMGSMAEAMKHTYIQRYGMVKWRRHINIVTSMWDGIKRKIEGLKLNCKKLKIYQDGLPLCGREMEIMEDVAHLGSHNYGIIKELVRKGSELIGTEDPKLLIEEYNFYKNLLSIIDVSKRKKAVQKAKKRRDELLNERDKFIADRIKNTLKRGETGILFIGIEHEVNKYLSKNIKVEYLIYRLPFKELAKA